jgi:hypothetical protein
MRRGLRPRRTYTKRCAVVLALATAGALTVTGIAAAASPTAGLSFMPNNPHGVFTPGHLFLGANTEYTTALSETATRIEHRLDDDFQFSPNAVPKCNPVDITGNMTMQQALQKCGPAAGAAKNAWLWPANALFSNGQAVFNVADTEFPTACVLAFNGSGSTSEVLLFIRVKLNQAMGPIDCGGPTTNTDGDISFLLQGDLKANPAIGGDFTDPDNCSAPDPRRGCQIDLNNVSLGPMRLVSLNISFKRGNYVRARCVDPPAGNRKWNLQARFTYAAPASTQIRNRSKTCT